MKSHSGKCLSVLVLLSMLCAANAVAELTVTVSISGSIEELLPVLQHLKDMGIGVGAEGDGLKLRMHSVITGDEAAPTEPAPPAEPPAPPKPILGLMNPAALPATVRPGGILVVTVKVGDPDHVIDTIGVTVSDGTSFDLYDNGTRGDAEALDGLWSRSVAVPQDMPAGQHVATITAYDVNGDPVMVPGAGGAAVPLAVECKVNVAE
ncbi:MAG: hypothetical protein JXR94_18620 [Candidatus Hydrogenedentes bacterium]|nr:hypothetical protein [Candidatus Hydrogenedentota bacterium]